MEETIPEDVWSMADSVWLELVNLGETMVRRREAEAEIIARAILAERERCARLAEIFPAYGLSEGHVECATTNLRSLATSIRSGV